MTKFFIVILFLLIAGCATQRRCASKFPPQVVHTVEKHTTVRDSIIKGAIVTDTLIIKELEKIPAYQYVIRYDTSGKALLRYYKDAYGRIVAECVSKDQLVEKIREIITENKTETKVVTQKERYTPWWLYGIMGVLAAVVVLFGIKILLRI